MFPVFQYCHKFWATDSNSRCHSTRILLSHNVTNECRYNELPTTASAFVVKQDKLLILRWGKEENT